MSMTTPPSKSNELKQLFSSILKHATANWPFKLIAIVGSIILWANLISQDPTLTREKTFTDVTVTIVGEDTMKRNGYIVTNDLSELLSGVSIRVDVPQMQYQNASITSYNPRIDLSKIKSTGTQSVKISTTNSTTYGTVTETNPETIELNVEEYITRYRIPVTINTQGAAPAGFYATSPSIDPPRVAISGPRSIVESVIRAEATLDLSLLPSHEGTIRTAVPLKLITSDGSTIESSLIEVTSESVLVDSVVVEQTLYSSKAVEINTDMICLGSPADGYEIKSVTVSPASLIIASKSEILNQIDYVYLDNQINLKDRTETFTQQVRITRPSDINYISTDIATVTVQIQPKKSFKTILNVKIDIVNALNGAKTVPSSKTATVVVTGPKNLVDKLKSSDITLFCDAAGLEQGEYRKLPVQWLSDTIDDTCDVGLSPETIDLSVK